MCSQNQPKQFPASDPLGTGGTFAPPTTFSSNAQPTGVAPAVAAPVKPPAPPATTAPTGRQTIAAPKNFRNPLAGKGYMRATY